MKDYIEKDEGGYRVAGTRVSLDSVVYAFREGQSPENIVQSFPVLQLEQIYGAITFYLAHRPEIDAYLNSPGKTTRLRAWQSGPRFGVLRAAGGGPPTAGSFQVKIRFLNLVDSSCRVPLMLSPQLEGGFTVTSPLLPELVTEGDTVREALANVQDALAPVIETYEDLGRPLPASSQLPAESGPV